MHKRIASNAVPVVRKTRKRNTSNEEKKQGKKNKEGSSLFYSLHKWGEDYYGAEDYYEKTVSSSMSKPHNYNVYQKKARKQ